MCVYVSVCLGMTFFFSHFPSIFHIHFFHFCIRIFTPLFWFYILIHLSFPFIDFICRRFKLCVAFAKILFQSAHKERKNQESALLYEAILLHLFRKHSLQDFQKTNKTFKKKNLWTSFLRTSFSMSCTSLSLNAPPPAPPRGVMMTGSKNSRTGETLQSEL